MAPRVPREVLSRYLSQALVDGAEIRGGPCPASLVVMPTLDLGVGTESIKLVQKAPAPSEVLREVRRRSLMEWRELAERTLWLGTCYPLLLAHVRAAEEEAKLEVQKIKRKQDRELRFKRLRLSAPQKTSSSKTVMVAAPFGIVGVRNKGAAASFRKKRLAEAAVRAARLAEAAAAQ